MFSTTQFATKSRDFAKRTLQYINENPGELIMFVMGIMLIDIDNTLESIEEHEEIQTAFDLWQYDNQGGV